MLALNDTLPIRKNTPNEINWWSKIEAEKLYFYSFCIANKISFTLSRESFRSQKAQLKSFLSFVYFHIRSVGFLALLRFNLFPTEIHEPRDFEKLSAFWVFLTTKEIKKFISFHSFSCILSLLAVTHCNSEDYFWGFVDSWVEVEEEICPQMLHDEWSS